MARFHLQAAALAAVCVGGLVRAAEAPHAPLSASVPLPTTAALPTTVPPMFYSEIVQKADVIVTGTVVSKEARYENGKATIRTYVTLGDLTFHKGAPRGSLTLRFEGGTIGDDTLYVAGMPNLKLGSKYFLYVDGTAHPEKVSPIVGFFQGAFEVVTRTDDDGNQKDVLVNMAGQELIGVRDDRFVFRKTDEVGGGNSDDIPAAPVVGEESHEVKWADPNVEALEARIMAQRMMEAQRARQDAKLDEQPAVPGHEVGGDAPPMERRPGDVVEQRDRTLASPLVLDAATDPGQRITVAGMLDLARTAVEDRR